MTPNESLDRFHRQLNARHLSNTTHSNYHLWVSRFFEYCRPDDVSELTIDDAQDFLLNLSENYDYADRTYNVAVDAIRSFFELVLHIHGSGKEFLKRKVSVVQKNLSENYDYADRTYNVAVDAIRSFFELVLHIHGSGKEFLKRKVSVVQKNPITPDQALTLLESCQDPMLKAAIALGFGCGMRIEEIVTLKVVNIHKGSRFITIENSKGNKTRTVKYKAAIALGFGCGMRIEEIVTLKVVNIHKGSRFITIENSKGNKTRTVKYSLSAMEILQNYCRIRGITSASKDSYIFPSEKKSGDHMSCSVLSYIKYSLSAMEILQNYCRIRGITSASKDSYIFPSEKKSGDHMSCSVLSYTFRNYLQTISFYLPDQTFHGLRHAFATSLANRNVPLPVIQKLMGHQSAATTAFYIHTPQEEPDELPDLLVREK